MRGEHILTNLHIAVVNCDCRSALLFVVIALRFALLASEEVIYVIAISLAPRQQPVGCRARSIKVGLRAEADPSILNRSDVSDPRVIL